MYVGVPGPLPVGFARQTGVPVGRAVGPWLRARGVTHFLLAWTLGKINRLIWVGSDGGERWEALGGFGWNGSGTGRKG